MDNSDLSISARLAGAGKEDAEKCVLCGASLDVHVSWVMSCGHALTACVKEAEHLASCKRLICSRCGGRLDAPDRHVFKASCGCELMLCCKGGEEEAEHIRCHAVGRGNKTAEADTKASSAAKEVRETTKKDPDVEPFNCSRMEHVIENSPDDFDREEGEDLADIILTRTVRTKYTAKVLANRKSWRCPSCGSRRYKAPTGTNVKECFDCGYTGENEV